MRDTASETLALPLEEAASSLSSTSMFNVGRSMFDVHPPSLNRHALGEVAWLVDLAAAKSGDMVGEKL
jgi:hypothetical protein